MEGEGLVSGKKVVLYCVLTRFEIHELKEISKTVDSSAFIAISDVSEIIGKHIKRSGKTEALSASPVTPDAVDPQTDNAAGTLPESNDPS